MKRSEMGEVLLKFKPIDMHPVNVEIGKTAYHADMKSRVLIGSLTMFWYIF